MLEIINITQGKATHNVISHVSREILVQTQIISNNFIHLIENLPNRDITEYHHKKLFLDLLFGITGTVFGIANSIAIASTTHK